MAWGCDTNFYLRRRKKNRIKLELTFLGVCLNWKKKRLIFKEEKAFSLWQKKLFGREEGVVYLKGNLIAVVVNWSLSCQIQMYSNEAIPVILVGLIEMECFSSANEASLQLSLNHSKTPFTRYNCWLRNPKVTSLRMVLLASANFRKSGNINFKIRFSKE